MGRDVDGDEALSEREPVEAADRGRAAPQARRRESRVVWSAAAAGDGKRPPRCGRATGPPPARAALARPARRVSRPRRGWGEPAPGRPRQGPPPPPRRAWRPTPGSGP